MPHLAHAPPSLLLASVALALAACAPPAVAPPPRAATANVAAPAVSACARRPALRAELAPAADDALLRDASGDPGKGNLCGAAVFTVVKPVAVYRVWEGEKATSKLGRWWTFAPPAGPLEAFRAAFNICPEWGGRDRVSVCRLKVGAKVVLGVGQSMKCAAGELPASSTEQVFIPNDTRDPANAKVFVDDCADAAWP